MDQKRLKVAFLSRYQNTVNRGVETFVKELSRLLSEKYQVEVLSGKDSDDFFKMISGKYDFIFSLNGRLQAIKASWGRIFGKYKLIIVGESGIGADDVFNVAVAKPDVFVGLTDYAITVGSEEKLNWWLWMNRKLRVADTWGWGSKIAKIPNGVDLDKFTPYGKKIFVDLPKPLILSVGALTWYKHHEKTVRAFNLLGQGSLLILGSGPEKKNLENLIRSLGLQERVNILQVDYQEIPAYYRSADLFVLPSWDREAFGIAYIEAMASNLPIVAPDDPPRREIVAEAGILVDVSNTEAYSKAMREALKKDWGDLPRRQAEKFSWGLINTINYLRS